MTKYTYKNIKHLTLHGIKPGETKSFDHEILGGGIELIINNEEKKEKKKTIKKLMENK